MKKFELKLHDFPAFLIKMQNLGYLISLEPIYKSFSFNGRVEHWKIEEIIRIMKNGNIEMEGSRFCAPPSSFKILILKET